MADISYEKLREGYVEAEKWHEGQVRKYTGKPYVLHPMEVASLLASVDILDEDLILAALFHDLFEDTDCPRAYIAQKYGKRVHDLVVELTEVPTEGNRKARKQAEAIRLGKISPDAMTVKCADLISNTRDIVKHDPGFAKVYLAEKANVLSLFEGKADPVIYAWAKRSLDEGFAALAAT